MRRCITITFISLLASAWSVPVAVAADAGKAKTSHTFAFGGERGEQFLLDGKPLQILGGEMHPARIPPEYWRHRIRMAKAMGLNTVFLYVFWNDHEQQEGTFDFTTGRRNIGRFLAIAQEEGMWVGLRPGPYCCAEWDFGGLPTCLLRYPDIKLRTMDDSRYTKAVERYFTELAKIVRPHLVGNGGAILLVQIENEYGSYQRRDHRYMVWLRDLWAKLGVPGPFYTADGAAERYLKGVVIPGVAVGLNGPIGNEKLWALARKMNPGVPAIAAETYPGWLLHWGEDGWKPRDIRGVLKFYMDHRKSFSLYMFHGGTNFGFTAGANDGGPGKYQPDVTSYDYAAPLDEQGRPTPAYHAYRALLASYLPAGQAPPAIPEPIPAMSVPPIPLVRWTSLWAHLPAPIASRHPATFESLGQNQGVVLYRTQLPAGSKGTLAFDALHDYAPVFVNGRHVGTLDRRLKQQSIDIADVGPHEAVLDVLVEGMGHVNFSIAMEADRKGIVGDVKLGDAVLTDWQMFLFPLKDSWAASLAATDEHTDRPGGTFFKGTFMLDRTADTFFDMSGYAKGVAWINGHNLGRHWRIGPQQRLYCPASWLRKGDNTILVLDQQTTEPRPVAGVASGHPEPEPRKTSKK
jgi:hypothetical protein